VTFDPNEFAALAAELSEPGRKPQEAHIRAAFGRAYYAAFLVAREALKSIGHMVPQSNAHWYVRAQLLNSKGNKAIVNLGQRLGELHDDRKDADYELGKPRRQKQGYQQRVGALTALRAKMWVDEFQQIPQKVLKTSCPP
jgi:hypothetical protein